LAKSSIVWCVSSILSASACTSAPPTRESVNQAASPLSVDNEQKLKSPAPSNGEHFATALAVADDVAVFGAPNNATLTSQTGALYIFRRSGATWSYAQQIFPPDADARFLGAGVAATKDTIVVTAETAPSFSSRLYVFTRNGQTFEPVQRIAAAPGQYFGTRLLLSESEFAVNGSSLQLYEKDGELWVPGPAVAEAATDFALEGNTLITTVSFESLAHPAQGVAHVFARSGSSFSELQELSASDARAGAHFGSAVALSGNQLFVGAADDENSDTSAGSGSAYVFQKTNGLWSETAKLQASDGASGDHFGATLSLLGDMALIGAPHHGHRGRNAGQGAAYLVTRTGSAWREHSELRSSDGQNNDNFGSTLALADNLAVIGAPDDDDVSQAVGSAYVYAFHGVLGDPCGSAAGCDSGFCSDGRCCDTACEGSCNACAVAAGATEDGHCALLPAGSLGSPSCAPITCSGTSQDCAVTPCTGDAGCPTNEFCDSLAVCRPRKAQGRACEPTAGSDCKADGCRVCATGSCVDGFCCNGACSGGCQACAQAFTGAPNGTCAPVHAGTDPRNVCAADPEYPSSCGADGQCDGAGACRTSAPAGTKCSPATCTATTLTEFTCDTSGACVPSTGSGGSGVGGSSSGTGGSGGTTAGGGAGGSSGSTGGTATGAGGTMTGTGGTTSGTGGSMTGTGGTVTGTGGTVIGTGGTVAGTGGSSGSGGGGACDSHPCTHGAACFALATGYACDCPTGTFGTRCEQTFVALADGDGFTCGVGADGQLSCWGQDDLRAAEPPSDAFRAVSGGVGYACGIRTNGTLVCWGDQPTPNGMPYAVPSGTFVALSGGSQHFCAIRSDGTLACSGDDAYGKASPPTGEFSAVSAGNLHTCGLRADGTLACWGYDVFGQSDPPAGSFKAVATGAYFSCAIDAAGGLACWGKDILAYGSPPSGTFTALAAGDYFLCALATDGHVSCWNSSVVDLSPPSGVFKSITASSGHACALAADDTVACWGTPRLSPPGRAFETFAEGCGRRGDGTFGCVDDLTTGPFTAVARGANYACGLRADQTLSCFETNPGQLDNRYGQATPPNDRFLAVAAGNYFTCGLGVDQTLECWGNDGFRQSTPPSGTFLSLCASANHACAVRNDHQLVCWGDDSYRGSEPPPGDFQEVTCGALHGCALDLEGHVACWGWDRYGQTDSPAGVFSSLASGEIGSCAVRAEDGSVACWGTAPDSQELPPPGSFESVSLQPGWACALRTDRTVVCWGYEARSLPPTQSAACDGQTCSGTGTCRPRFFGADCQCPVGYAQPHGDLLACVPDGCFGYEPPCDREAACWNTLDGAVCGPCPPGYSGTGDTECVPP
jgi:alpha-tubulin suppressor-like RCC1 family protein